MKKPIKPTYGFAAIHTDTHPRTGPWIITGSVRSYAKDSRQWVGQSYAMKGETAEQGWKRAREAGVRIIRVRIEADEMT